MEDTVTNRNIMVDLYRQIPSIQADAWYPGFRVSIGTTNSFRLVLRTSLSLDASTRKRLQRQLTTWVDTKDGGVRDMWSRFQLIT